MLRQNGVTPAHMMEVKDYPQNICSTCRQVLRPETDVAVAAAECIGGKHDRFKMWR